MERAASRPAAEAAWRLMGAIVAFVIVMASVVAIADDVPVPGTYTEAMRWYQRAAAAGNAQAQYLLATRLGQGPAADPAAARRWYARAAATGHVAAQERLAAMLYSGRGGARDLAAAAGWWARAADGGSPTARFNLGLMLERGTGVPRRPDRAAAFYEGAAAGGVGEAAAALGALYARGHGVETDPLAALAWLEIAAGLGAAVDDSVRDAISRRLTTADVAAAGQRAAAWLDARRRGTGNRAAP